MTAKDADKNLFFKMIPPYISVRYIVSRYKEIITNLVFLSINDKTYLIILFIQIKKTLRMKKSLLASKLFYYENVSIHCGSSDKIVWVPVTIFG